MKFFYERRKGEWSDRRTELKSVGVKRGPEIKRLAQLMASYYWDSKQLGPVVAKKPSELFVGKSYDKITQIRPDVAYQLFVLDDVIEMHVNELSRTKRYVGIFARHMKYALFALIVRVFQSIDVEWGSEKFTRIVESELESATARWRKLVLQAIDYIRSAYKTEDRNYRQAEKQPLPVVYFFKNQTYIDRIFPTAVVRSLGAAGRAVVQSKPTNKAKGKQTERAEHEGTKRAEVLALLRRSKGATTADICKTTGWTQHSVHGFLTALRKQEKLTAKRVKGRTRVYHVAA